MAATTSSLLAHTFTLLLVHQSDGLPIGVSWFAFLIIPSLLALLIAPLVRQFHGEAERFVRAWRVVFGKRGDHRFRRAAQRARRVLRSAVS